MITLTRCEHQCNIGSYEHERINANYMNSRRMFVLNKWQQQLYVCLNWTELSSPLFKTYQYNYRLFSDVSYLRETSNWITLSVILSKLDIVPVPELLVSNNLSEFSNDFRCMNLSKEFLILQLTLESS